MFKHFKPQIIEKETFDTFYLEDKSNPTSLLIDEVSNKLYIAGNKRILVLEPGSGKELERINLKYKVSYLHQKDEMYFYAFFFEPAGMGLIDKKKKELIRSTSFDGDNIASFSYSERNKKFYISLLKKSAHIFVAGGNLKESFQIPLFNKERHFLKLDNEQKRLYVSNEKSDTVSVIDTDVNKIIAHIKLPNEQFLKRDSDFNVLALSPDDKKLYVGCAAMNDTLTASPLYIIETLSYKIIKVIMKEYLRDPLMIEFNKFAKEAYVVSDGAIYIVDTDIQSPEMINEITVGSGIYDLKIFDKGEKILAIDFNTSVAAILNSQNNKMHFIKTEKDPLQVVISEKKRRAYIACYSASGISVINLDF